jgi:hypothetical protein
MSPAPRGLHHTKHASGVHDINHASGVHDINHASGVNSWRRDGSTGETVT